MKQYIYSTDAGASSALTDAPGLPSTGNLTETVCNARLLRQLNLMGIVAWRLEQHVFVAHSLLGNADS